MTTKKKPQPERGAMTSGSRGEATRAKLVEAAYRLFLRRGFHGASMRQIADEAGLAVGGIYNHFASKEEIFAAVLDAYHPYHVMVPALEETQGETVEVFIRDAAGRIRAAIAGRETKLLPLVFTELVEFQGRHLQQVAKRVLPSLMSFMQRLAGRRGNLRPLPLPVILRAFISLMVGYVLTEVALKGSPLLKQNQFDWFGGLVDIYLHGVIAEETP
jgi:AcrR family transcriptional regulator